MLFHAAAHLNPSLSVSHLLIYLHIQTKATASFGSCSHYTLSSACLFMTWLIILSLHFFKSNTPPMVFWIPIIWPVQGSSCFKGTREAEHQSVLVWPVDELHEVMRRWIGLVGRKAEIWCLFDFGVQKYTLYSYYISNFILPQPLPSTQPPQLVAFPCHQLLSLLQ